MQTLHYTIYKTINLINNKIYIGKHITSDLNDGYMGSGKRLKYAIKKYGIDNFCKDILFVFDNEEDMNTKEAELVTAEFVLQETNYNLCVGGCGGFSYINRVRNHKEHNQMIANARDYSQTNYDYRKTDEYRQLVSMKTKTAWIDSNKMKTPVRTGLLHSVATKIKMSDAHLGSNNSQFGSRWITNGIVSKKIRNDDIIPNGWNYGRTK